MTSINNSAFHRSFSEISNFDLLLPLFKSSPTFMSDLNALVEKGKVIYIGFSGYGSFVDPSGNIALDPNIFTNMGNGLGQRPTSTVVTLIGHELGHAVKPNGKIDFMNAVNPQEAANLALVGEGGRCC